LHTNAAALHQSRYRAPQSSSRPNDLFGFLTTEPNAEAGSIHPKAMPVILTTPAEN
jgi:putative SOS response-associated peptidase YedK